MTIVPLAHDESTVASHLLDLGRGSFALARGDYLNEFWKLPRPKDRRGAALRALVEERKKSR